MEGTSDCLITGTAHTCSCSVLMMNTVVYDRFSGLQVAVSVLPVAEEKIRSSRPVREHELGILEIIVVLGHSHYTLTGSGRRIKVQDK